MAALTLSSQAMAHGSSTPMEEVQLWGVKGGVLGAAWCYGEEGEAESDGESEVTAARKNEWMWALERG